MTGEEANLRNRAYVVALALLGTGHYLSPGGMGSGGFGTKQGEI